MSAALIVLPTVWAYAEAASAGSDHSPVSGRKGPRSLQLIWAGAEPAAEARAGETRAVAPEMAFYRKYTEAMLRRCLTMSMEGGRVSSVMGRELFRGNLSNTKVRGFDDVVIYVHDVERCVSMLEPGQQHLIRRIALEGYTQPETAAMLGITLRTIARRYGEALDRLTRMFLRKEMLKPMEECVQGSGRLAEDSADVGNGVNNLVLAVLVKPPFLWKTPYPIDSMGDKT